MHTPTLGYEDDTQITKSEIARVQLTEAIALFLEEKFLCSITLAGAAEEVFARLLNAHGEESVVEDSFKSIQKLREATSFSAMKNHTKNEIFKHWNIARNAIKHHNKDEEETVTINLFDEAYWMIKRGIANASKLDITIHNESDFENWCIVKIHL